jgi:acyl-CoA reductase-like NAD-dependent aldehyde dehydrogenase
VIDPSTDARSAASSTLPTPTSTAPSPAARQAFDDGRWTGLMPIVRESMIHKLADLIERHADEFAELEAIDNGKPKTIAAALDIPRDRHAALHGRLDDQDRRRDDGADGGAERRVPCLCPPRAGGRRRPDRAVELPDDHGDAEDRAGAGGGLHPGA